VLQEGQERKTILDRLFKIAQLEDTYHELGGQEGPIRKLQDRREANRLEKARLEGDASKLDQEQALYQKSVQERQLKRNKLDKMREEYGQLKAIAQSVADEVSCIDGLDTKISQAQALMQTSRASVRNLLSQLRGLLSDGRFSIIETLHAPETREHLIKLETELVHLKTERDHLDADMTESLKKAASAQARCDDAVKQKSEFEKQLGDINSYLDGKGEQPEIRCDRCGSLLTSEQWVKHTDEIKRKLGETETEVNTTKELWSNEILNGKGIQEKLVTAKARVENQEKAIGTIGQLATLREETERAEGSESQLLKEKKQAISELRSLFENADDSDDEMLQKSRMLPANLEALLETIEDAQRVLTSYDEDVLTPQAKRVETAKEADTKAKGLQPQIDLDAKKIEMLQTVRTAFREIQPAVRKSLVAKITVSANDYLKRLYGGAEIENFEFSEDYEFLVTRAGHKRHAYRLSGGQQVLASMAFLMALSEVLSELDFLILDEPTTHLDENRRKELVNVLENLRRVPQLIIVDHHPELFAAADTRFQVNLTSEGQSQVIELSGQ
jgi:exonuclease SbcC